MELDRFILFKRHPCSHGLSQEVIEEIASNSEAMRIEPGEIIVHADEPVTSIYLIVHGRLRITLIDIQGRVVMERFQAAGGQFGGMAAATAEPTPVTCVAVDPTVLLRIDYAKAFELTKKYDGFRANFTGIIANSVKQMIMNDKAPVRPSLTAFFHHSDKNSSSESKAFATASRHGGVNRCVLRSTC